MDILVALGALLGLLWGIYEGREAKTLFSNNADPSPRGPTRKQFSRTDEEILQSNEEGRTLLLLGKEYHQLKMMSLEILEQNRKATVVLDDMMRRLDELEDKLRHENFCNQDDGEDFVQFPSIM